jgi:hypothetical protein
MHVSGSFPQMNLSGFIGGWSIVSSVGFSGTRKGREANKSFIGPGDLFHMNNAVRIQFSLGVSA